ncbi:GNAT family N-acetyltransferase [Deinococcus sp. QL22]|uniref:GNAT family N-acetyltransferase n=1 Tax=Deinococcus sp. QL22 TaxID=2939437 RepID=UPI002016F87C|nr:GNAT family N-acetyltransferase [Deinococcus sp. QL22]UQN07179.1 GNAT family N-acetyltransferase [Deinococcus sp. QL22]
MAHLYFFPFNPPRFLHVALQVHPAARGKGVGSALWTTVLEEARQQGAALAASVDDTDAESLRWATRRGFVQHAHRFASELDLTTFDAAAHAPALAKALAQGVTFTDLAGLNPSGADTATVDRYLNFVADRLTETPDMAGHSRWPLEQVREMLRLDGTPDFPARPDWLILALAPDGTWLGTTAMIGLVSRPFLYNELTAVIPKARGRGLALPLKLQAIARAQAEGYALMRTNNHSTNAPMLRVNHQLGFVPQPGRFEMHLSALD